MSDTTSTSYSDKLLGGLTNAIVERRHELKLSQEKMSSISGLSRSYVADIERKSRSFSLRNLVRLAEVLQLRPSELLNRAEHQVLKSVSHAAGVGQTLLQSRLGITICDARQPDLPIVFANAGFEVLTGYSHAEIIGKNCRFLQNGHTDQPGLDLIREALRKQVSVSAMVINYTKSGELLHNQVSITPDFDSDGLAYFIGVQCIAAPVPV